MARTKEVEIFISYANNRKDKGITKNLKNHLKSLKSSPIKVWNDDDLIVGENWDTQIKEKLKSADIILFLISVDLLNSQYVNEVELKKAIQKHKRGNIKIIPIIGRECTWKESIYAKLEVLPKNGKPIKSRGWDNPDAPYTSIANSVLNISKEIIRKRRKRKLRKIMLSTFIFLGLAGGVVYYINPDFFDGRTMGDWLKARFDF